MENYTAESCGWFCHKNLLLFVVGLVFMMPAIYCSSFPFLRPEDLPTHSYVICSSSCECFGVLFRLLVWCVKKNFFLESSGSYNFFFRWKIWKISINKVMSFFLPFLLLCYSRFVSFFAFEWGNSEGEITFGNIFMPIHSCIGRGQNRMI